MSCYQSATASVVNGTTGPMLVINVKAYSGIVPPELAERHPPFDPKNVFPVTVVRSVPGGATIVDLKLNHNLQSGEHFDFVEIFCGDAKTGTQIPVTR
jgi:hypothetical protein